MINLYFSICLLEGGEILRFFLVINIAIFEAVLSIVNKDDSLTVFFIHG